MIEEKLYEDYKLAMKAGDKIKKDTIQQLRASILLAKKNTEFLSDTDIENIIVKEKNKRLDALAQFEKAKRKDLIEQTQAELSCINSYLPQPMSDEELEIEISKLIEQENIEDLKMMGFIIQKARDKFGSRTSGRQISDMVNKLLNRNNEV